MAVQLNLPGFNVEESRAVKITDGELTDDEALVLVTRARYESMLRNERPHGLAKILDYECMIDLRALRDVHPLILISALIKTEKSGRELNIRLASLMSAYLST